MTCDAQSHISTNHKSLIATLQYETKINNPIFVLFTFSKSNYKINIL